MVARGGERAGERGRAQSLAGLVYRSRPLVVRRVRLAGAVHEVAGVSDRRWAAIAPNPDVLPAGPAAAHVVALSAVSLVNELASWLIAPDDRARADDWRDRAAPSFGVLVVAIAATCRAAGDDEAAEWRAYLNIGLPQVVGGLGAQASAHHGVRAVLRDLQQRLAFEVHAGRFDAEAVAFAQEKPGRAAVRQVIGALDSWRLQESPAQRWPAWAGVENLLDAEFLRIGAGQQVDQEPWLPIDLAADRAGWKLNLAGRCDRARRAAKWKRVDRLPTKKVSGKLCARVSDCLAWKPRAEAMAEAFARPARESAAPEPRNTPQRSSGTSETRAGSRRGRA